MATGKMHNAVYWQGPVIVIYTCLFTTQVEYKQKQTRQTDRQTNVHRYAHAHNTMWFNDKLLRKEKSRNLILIMVIR